MYKFRNHLTNSGLVLVRKHIKDGSCSVILLRHPSRSVVDKPAVCPPPDPKPGGRKLLYGTIGTIIVGGSFCIYAKNSPDTRNWLATNAPILNELVAVVFQENTTYTNFAWGQFDKFKTRVGNFVFGKEGVTPVDLVPRAEQDLEKDAKEGFAPKSYILPAPTLEPLYMDPVIVGHPEVEEPATLVQTDKLVPLPSLNYTVPKDVVDLEKEMHDNTKTGVEEFTKAVKICHEFNKYFHKIFEPLSTEDLPWRYFATVKQLQDQRLGCMAKGKEAAKLAREAMDTIEKMIENNQLNVPPDRIAITQRYIKTFREDLANSELKADAEYDKFVLSDKFWDRVIEARKAYQEELRLLYPDLDIEARILDPKGEVDLLLLYTARQVAFYQKELIEAQVISEAKINRAIECRDEDMIYEAKADNAVKKERLAREMEFNKKLFALMVEQRKKQKEELKKQAELHEQIFKARMAEKEKEIMNQYKKALSEALEKEQMEFKKELASMSGKMQAIEDVLKKRAQAEAEAKRSQSVWTAAEALLATTRKPGPESKVANEVKALEKAGQGDKLVATVIKGISKETRERGIRTETALRDSFNSVEKTAMKVALISREGASLPMYFLSWLQSKLIFQQLAEIPRDELENRPVDFTKLDTFDIIQRARYYVNCNNFEHALRYINLLQGAPRAAARCWLEDTKRYLEVKQAAEAVLAHASLSGLLYS